MNELWWCMKQKLKQTLKPYKKTQDLNSYFISYLPQMATTQTPWLSLFETHKWTIIGGERPTTTANGQTRWQPLMPSMTLPTPTPSHIASSHNPTLVQLWLTISLAAIPTVTMVTTANRHLLKSTPALHFLE